MKTDSFFVIQDMITKEYYVGYMENDAFDANIRNAYTFNSPEDALDELNDHESSIYKEEAFEKRYLLILQINKTE